MLHALVVIGLVACPAVVGQDLELVDPFPNLTLTADLTDIQNAGDGSNTLYLVEQLGVIRAVENDPSTTTMTTFLDITDRVSQLFSGLLSLLFDPDYESNGFFYVYYSTPDPILTRISRFSRSASNPEAADPTSEVILFEMEQPSTSHHGGQLVFGPEDGYLYLSLGDGSTPPNNSQDVTNLLGSIVRLDIHGGGSPLECATGAATIPPDNPLADGAGPTCDEIWAFGFRNPFRMAFDPFTHDLILGDVGVFS